MRRRQLAFFAIILLILAAATAGWAGQALTIGGVCLDAQGKPTAGLIVSDEFASTVSAADGRFSLASAADRVLWFAAPDGQAVEGRWWLPTAQATAPLEVRLRPAPTPVGGVLRLAIVSDPHLFDHGSQPSYFDLGEEAAQTPMLTWRKVAQEAAASKPDLTIALGDLCCDADKGGRAHAEAQMALAVKAAAMLPQPWRAIPGNHDVRYDDDAVDYSFWRRAMGPTRHVYLIGGAALIMLDNVSLGRNQQGKAKNCGATDEQSLAWLAGLLPALPPDRPLIVLTHFPLASAMTGHNPLHKNSLVETTGKPGLALRDADQNADKLMELLRGRRIIALFNGHEHIHHGGYLAARQGRIDLVAAPAVCGRWWAGEMAWGPLSFAPGWLAAQLNPTAADPALKVELHAITPPVNLHGAN